MPDKLSKYSYASIKAIPSGEFVVGESYEIIYRHTFEAGGGGHFVFFKGDFSSEVANDPEEGVYLCLDEDPSGESYVLIRRLQGFICPHDFGAFGKEGVNDSTAIHAANNYAALVGLPLRFSNKTYFVGDASFVIEASKTSWFSDGLTLIKFSGFESRKKYAVRVVGSGSYVATVRLVKAFIKNIGIFANVQKGSELEGVGLELSGGTSATRLSSGSFDHISIQGFKTSVKFNDYCWKITLNNARLMWGVIETPSETQEFGENMVLRDCFIADTSGEFSRFNKGEWKFYGTSFDNAPFSSHNDAVLDFEGGHIENPLSQSSEPRFAEAYNFSSISFNATWIATNNRAIARPPFFCDTSVAKPSGLYFNTCKWVCYAEYDTREGGSNAGAMSHNFLVEGEGTVRSNNWTFLNWQDWLAIPLARSSNRLFNGDFERGDLRAWSVSEGLGGGTGIFEVNAVTGEGQRGAYCAEIRALHLGSHAFGGLTLIPGDSPMGLRLPLGELSSHKDDPKVLPEADPFAVQQALPQEPIHTANTASQTHREQAPKPASGRELITTALCVQPRDGKLHVFLPPLEQLTDYLALIQAIESVAKTLSCPVVLEGYTPPKDARLTQLLVTPDPGVIEVNVHPASNWDELVSTTTELYHAARESRLCAEKFMLDGRHTGTGGGNHMTLGGKTPADSPFLRRPDLLRSLITFWQHHPSLSYLFSGTFIGPTSQAPRMDEGRDEMLYELEIAFQQLPDGESQQPWLIDRILRNLLIDITGNTHRAEFCIDKLYAPGTTSGRQGLLEFRGFEMPPHPQMSLVQALLIRALVSLFWQKPYKHNLVRWGTALHDKFMLPHFIWRDVLDVVEQLQQHGIQFDPEWLRPFEEFRFPHYGRVKLDDIDIELRWAIEPWHVLGEEVGSFGTARYVDSSVERLQVRLTGLTPERYVLACNGRRVPLHATGRGDEFIAGIRYRAWAPPSALHPTIGTHVPLVFDLIDTWNGRSVGGCTYHVSHPGGLSYETYPINAFEAESRRVNRFSREEHSQGPYQPQPAYIPKPSNKAERQLEEYEGMKGPLSPPAEESSGEYPFTLDLRRAARFI